MIDAKRAGLFINDDSTLVSEIIKLQRDAFAVCLRNAKAYGAKRAGQKRCVERAFHAFIDYAFVY